MSYIYLCHGHLWYQAYHLTDSTKANNTPKMSNCSWQSFMVSDNPDIFWILANSKTINRHEVLKKTFGCALKLYGAKLTIYKCVCSLKVPGKKNAQAQGVKFQALMFCHWHKRWLGSWQNPLSTTLTNKQHLFRKKARFACWSCSIYSDRWISDKEVVKGLIVTLRQGRISDKLFSLQKIKEIQRNNKQNWWLFINLSCRRFVSTDHYLIRRRALQSCWGNISKGRKWFKNKILSEMVKNLKMLCAE